MSRSWTLKLDGERIKKRHREAAAAGLRKGAEHILQEARTRVPIEEGTLERSGAASVDDARLVAAVSFDTPYAVVQHEDMTLAHDAGRSAKYLEQPMTSERPTVLRIVAEEIRRRS